MAVKVFTPDVICFLHPKGHHVVKFVYENPCSDGKGSRYPRHPWCLASIDLGHEVDPCDAEVVERLGFKTCVSVFEVVSRRVSRLSQRDMEYARPNFMEMFLDPELLHRARQT